jgi:HK97 family phage portal protein
MRLFGLPIPFTETKAATLAPVSENRGWYRVLESFSGAWQHNIVVDRNLVLSYHAVYACMTLIASDIAKLRVKLVEQDENGIWTETRNAAYSPVLRKPNQYQNRIQFWENWILSKLARGNTYALKVRDNRGVVTKLYILDPMRVMPLVADDGSVFYQLSADNLAALEEDVTVPAREIIHDRMNCLFHPLVGTSPIYAAGVAATQGINIQNNSATFFGNKSRPSGILTAPGAISTATADRLKEAWQANYSGENYGKVAVLGDGLKFEPMAMTAEESQLIEQLKWTAEVVCSTFHVPPYMVGVGTMPTYNNIEALSAQYYSQCLQSLIESAELCLDEGLGLDEPKDGKVLGTEFDLEGLLRMDTQTQYKTIAEGIRGGFLAPNEARKRIDLKPLEGGNTVYLQEQDHSLAALAKRDAGPDPFGKAKTEPAPAAPEAPAANDNSDEQREARSLVRRASLAKRVGLKSIPVRAA